ncbi:SapC family protein [Hydrogenobacter sp. T-2]|uniref:SapC family protein n=1 Tax=Pampinifervens diazotrophicum TaxID=1632018 RepID=UPI002B25F158|nr:SapC family protein [Hydrogenobacter sp. T-2]WPM32782.1 SapC family protein [Hydrogenobacter sp. T-2]
MRLFSNTLLPDPEEHKNLKWQCLKSNCPQSCCFIPDRTFVVLEEVLSLSRHFPVVINIEVDQEGKEQRLLCAYFRLKEDKKGCVYLKDGMGCLIEEEKPYTCRQYPFFIREGYLALDLTCPGFSEVEGVAFWEGQFVNPLFERDFYTYSLRIEEGKAQTEEFVNTLFDLGLVVGGRISYEDVEVSFNMVDEERLFELPTDTLRLLSKKGYTKLIYSHLNSLQNWERLIKRYISG